VEVPDQQAPRGEHPDGQTPRAKAVTFVVVAVVLAATLVLCCVAIGQLGALVQLRLPPP
jgi:hypothetical protein